MYYSVLVRLKRVFLFLAIVGFIIWAIPNNKREQCELYQKDVPQLDSCQKDGSFWDKGFLEI